MRLKNKMVYNALKRIEKNKPITNLNLTLKEIDYIIKGLFWVLDTSKNKKVDDLINRFIDIKINDYEKGGLKEKK